MIVRNYREVNRMPVVGEPGVVVRWLVSEADETPHFALRLYEIEPGAVTATHIHYWEHQVFVLSGRGAAIGDKGEIPISEGDLIYVPQAERHQFANRGSELLRFLMVLPIAQYMGQCPNRHGHLWTETTARC
jgi:quercetin dioxygenase-like cupin family protein